MNIRMYNKGTIQQKDYIIKKLYNKFPVSSETVSIEIYNKGTVQQRDCVTKGLNNKKIV